MKKTIKAVAVLVLLSCCAGAAAVAFAPFQTHIALRRLALWRAGARRTAAGPLLAYEMNSCRPGAPCRCVALVHGMGDSALTWDKTLKGTEGAAPPPAGTLLLAVDMPGTDGSAPASDYGIRAQALILRQALEPRCPEWTVAGNSLGGWMSLWLAVDWPAGVKKLVLVNAAGLSDPSGLGLLAARTLAEPTVAAMKDFSTRAYAHPQAVPPRAWPAVVDSIRARPPRAILAALSLADVLDGRLKDVKAETVIVWGDHDGILPPSFAARFASGIRGSRLEPAKDCGHLPQQECPEIVSRALY